MSIKGLNILTLTVLVLLSACQSEIDELVQPQSQTITSSSTLASLLQKVSMMDGSPDNILDEASCLSVVYPVTVMVNGSELTLNAASDLKYVERLLDESDADDDTLLFVFPIQVVLSNHDTVIVENKETLDSLADECIEGGSDDDIECIDINYPITVFVYNSTTQIQQTIVIESDSAFFSLVSSLEEEDVVSLEFPISIVLSDSSLLVAADLDQLESLIEVHEDDCDEDDDIDHDEDDIDTSAFNQTLISNQWIVSSLIAESENLTEEFESMVITFDPEGAITISMDGDTIATGEWETYGDDGTLELKLEFEDESPYDLLDEDWVIVSHGSTSIDLKVDDGEETTKTLTLVAS